MIAAAPWRCANRRRRRPPRLPECDLGPVIGAVAVQRHAAAWCWPARRRLVRPGLAAAAAGVVLLALAWSVYAAIAAPGCALDSLGRDQAVELARALRADLLAAVAEIKTPKLSADEKRVLISRLDRRVRFADSIIVCGD